MHSPIIEIHNASKVFDRSVLRDADLKFFILASEFWLLNSGF